jgi:DNA ligase-1
VYESLSDLEKMGGAGSQEEKAKKLKELLKKLEPESGKYIMRIILGTLRLGFSDMTIIDALSWMEAGDKSLRTIIEGAYNICADIGLIAQTLKDKGMQGIEDMKIQVGIPIRPAAAERLPTAKAIIEKLGSCSAQPKIDGFRLQIHVNKKGNHHDVRFFSRNLQDMSHMFPDVLKEIDKLKVDTLICEGEAIAWDPETKTYLKFQETVKRKRKHGISKAASDYPLHVYLFDLLYLNGENYMDKTQVERRAALANIFKGTDSTVVSLIEEKKVDTAKELEDYFHENISAGLEGLVVKKLDSKYQPGKRNFNWIKLKRQEEGHLEDTVDCVILGYYAGSGKRASFGVGAFLVGVYNKRKDVFQTVAKIGTGLTDLEWHDLKYRCDRIKVPSKPARVECAKELYPDVWVAPDIVCMIRADEITMSPLHTADKTSEHPGYALRFPRFMGYRPDKFAGDATTVSEISHLYKNQFTKK